MTIQELTLNEVEMVSGAGDVKAGVIGWVVGLILDGAVSYISSLNQGGTADYTDPMGNMSGGGGGGGGGAYHASVLEK